MKRTKTEFDKELIDLRRMVGDLYDFVNLIENNIECLNAVGDWEIIETVKTFRDNYYILQEENYKDVD